MNRLLLHIALLLCAPRSFGYAIRTGLISAFAMRLYRQNKRKVFGDYKINAILLKGNFVKERNYYEDFVDFYKWW